MNVDDFLVSLHLLFASSKLFFQVFSLLQESIVFGFLFTHVFDELRKIVVLSLDSGHQVLDVTIRVVLELLLEAAILLFIVSFGVFSEGFTPLFQCVFLFNQVVLQSKKLLVAVEENLDLDLHLLFLDFAFFDFGSQFSLLCQQVL